MVRPHRDRETTARPTPAPEGVSLSDILQILRRRKIYLIVPILLSLAYFGYRAWAEQPWYESSTVLLAEQLDDYEALEPGAPVWISDHIGAIRELIHRPSFLSELARRYELYELQDGQVSSGDVADLSSRVWVSQEGEDTFSLGFTGDDPKKVAEVTAGMADLFIERMKNARNTRVEAVNEVVDSELADLDDKLDQQEARIEAYKQRSGQTLPENLPVLVGELSSLRGEAQDKAAEIANLQADLAQVQSQLQAMDERGVVQRDPEVEKLRTELATLRKRYTEEHPEVQRVRQQLAALEETRSSPSGKSDVELHYIELQAQERGLNQRIAAEQRTLQGMRARIGGYEGQIAAMPEREREMSQLMRDYQVTQDAYDELLARRRYTDVTHKLSRSTRGLSFVVVDPARVPTAPAGPERWRPILMGLVVGLTVAGLLTLLVEQFDTTLDDVDDVERIMQVPALAAIPSLPAKGHPKNLGRSGKLRLPTLYDPLGTASEQYRILAMSVRRMLDSAGARTIMVTSGGGGEGKTTTAVNLANALAEQAPGNVLLVDWDLRRPRIHEYLAGHLAGDSEERSQEGLRHLLQNPEAPLDAHIERIGKLHVVSDDSPSRDSYEQLATRAPRVLERLTDRFRYVVLDAPPILPMVDGHLLAEAVDAVLFVVRARHTPREVVERSMELFDFSNTLGVVLNDVDFRGKKYASAYTYYEKEYAHAAEQRATT